MVGRICLWAYTGALKGVNKSRKKLGQKLFLIHCPNVSEKY